MYALRSPIWYRQSSLIVSAATRGWYWESGPCECDLYLSCAKFATTREYAPWLRTGRLKEMEVIEDAISHGWGREVERHRCTVRRVEQLLVELGEPLDGSGEVE